MKWNSIDSNPFNWSNISHVVPSHYVYLEPDSGTSSTTNNKYYKITKTEIPDDDEDDYTECPYISKCQLEPDRVIFQDPATIVYWNDGTKTVVKTSADYNDQFEPEVGFAMAFLRKYFGDRGTYLRMMYEKAEWREPKASKEERKNARKME